MLTVLLFVILVITYLYFKYELNYWKNRDVPYEKGHILVGNLGSALMMTRSATDIYGDIYKKFQGYKYCGVFHFRVPALLALDVDFIKDVLIRKFNHFHDTPFPIDEKKDPILTKNPFFSKGERWKLIRAQLTPQFTSGKIKSMLPLLNDIGNKLVKYLSDKLEYIDENGLNAKELSGKFTADAVASCGFGMDGQSFVDPKAEFMEMGKKIMQSSYLDTIILMLMFVFPEITKIKMPKYISDDMAERFRNIILTNMKERELKNITRGDFLDALAEMRKTTTAFDYNTDYVIAHAMSFFLDGFETSSILLQYVYHELGVNYDVQKKLREEIENVLPHYGGDVTYESLQEMKYLDMVIKETLRKYPPGTIIFRECTEKITLDPAKDGGKPLLIEKGIQVLIPVMAVHYDPKYYPNPDKFIPERFSDESNNMSKQAYFPFGEGPRMCLGRRFAITQVKVAVVFSVMNFEIRSNKKTKLPLELDPAQFLHAVKGGIWINFHKLKKE